MTNFDGKISAIFMNIATDTDSKESYKYFKDSVKYLMEEYAKEKLEKFIDDHFPEDSLKKFPPELEGIKWLSGTFEGAGWRKGISADTSEKSDVEHEYKIGDKVRIINKDSHFFPIGSIVTLVRVDNDADDYHAKGKGPNEKDNEYFQILNRKNFVLAFLKHEYKVGDNVRIVKNDLNFYKIGTVVKIIKKYESGRYDLFGTSDPYRPPYNQHFVKEEEFVPAEEPLSTKLKIIPQIDKETFYTFLRHPVNSTEYVDIRSKPDASFTGDSLDHFVEGSWEILQRQPSPDRPFTQYELDHPFYFSFKEKPSVIFSSPFKKEENPVKIKVEKAGHVKTVPPGKLSAYSLDLKRWVLDGEETTLGKVKIIGDEIHYNLRF